MVAIGDGADKTEMKVLIVSFWFPPSNVANLQRRGRGARRSPVEDPPEIARLLSRAKIFALRRRQRDIRPLGEMC
jgi:hypothetical protein